MFTSAFSRVAAFRNFALGLAGLASVAASSATTKTYIGPFNGNWNSAANWDPSGVPVGGSTASNGDIAVLGTALSFQSGAATVNFDIAYSGFGLLALDLDAAGSNSSITLEQSSPSSAMVATEERLGYTVAGNTYRQSAGTNVCQSLFLGVYPNGSGSYLLSGGSLSTRETYAGDDGPGTFVHSGGTHTVSNVLIVSEGGPGTYQLSGTGVLNANAVSVARDGGGTGLFQQTGGTATITNAISMGPGGTYQLSGGTLKTPLVRFGATGSTGTFKFNGGTLQPRANSTDFIHFIAHAYVQSAGAVIHTNGFNITIAQSLEHDPALGTTVDGGLQKNGSGVLQLTGANTYTGNTVVNEGALRINNTTGSGTGTGIVTVKSGAVFVGGIGAENGGTLDSTTRSYTGYNGVISGLLSPESGGMIVPGNSIGTLRVGSLTLNPGAILNYELTTAANDFIRATALRIDGGGINLYAEGTTSPFSTPGLYHLMGYSGDASSVANLSVLNPVVGRSYTFVNNTTLKTVDLIIEGPTIRITSITKPTGGSVVLMGKGVPGAMHKIQATDDISQPFNTTPIGTPVADSNGNFQFNENTNAARRFYRAVYP